MKIKNFRHFHLRVVITPKEKNRMYNYFTSLENPN